MKLGRTILATGTTKCGDTAVTVNIVVDGPRDGCISVLEGITVDLLRLPRLADATASPPHELHDGDSLEDVELAWPEHKVVRTLPVTSVSRIERPPLKFDDDAPAQDVMNGEAEGGGRWRS